MSSKKKTETNQTQTQTNTYGFVDQPITPQMQDYRNQIDTTYGQADPSIGYSYANQRNEIDNQFGSPYGADYSPETRDAIKYNETQKLNQEQGQAVRGANYANQQGKLGALGDYANATQSKFVQTGGTGTSQGTTVEKIPFNWGNAINAGAQIGRAALM